MKLRLRYAVALGLIALAATLIPLATQGDDFALAATADNQCWKFKPSERGFTTKMNAERSAQGLGTLSLDPELSRAARKHTQEMWSQELLYHTPSDKLRFRITNWMTIGENVGVGAVVQSLHDAFMNSPAHKANIMYKTYKHVGVGVAEKNDRMWVTVIFEATDEPGTPLSMPRC